MFKCRFGTNLMEQCEYLMIPKRTTFSDMDYTLSHTYSMDCHLGDKLLGYHTSLDPVSAPAD